MSKRANLGDDLTRYGDTHRKPLYFSPITENEDKTCQYCGNQAKWKMHKDGCEYSMYFCDTDCKMVKTILYGP